MAKFLLPFDARRCAIARISPTSLLLASVLLAIMISLQTDFILVLWLLFFVIVGGIVFRTRWKDVIPLIARFELIILFWVLLEPFLYGSTVVLSIELPWGTLHAYQEGLLLGLLLGARMLTLIMLFTITLSHISLTEFIGALRTLKIPEVILGSLMIMLRYIPLFIEERERMHDAQVLRGYDKGERFEKVKSIG
jgi:energy-coupling factor transporter transmembrane protein EcfT